MKLFKGKGKPGKDVGYAKHGGKDGGIEPGPAYQPILTKVEQAVESLKQLSETVSGQRHRGSDSVNMYAVNDALRNTCDTYRNALQSVVDVYGKFANPDSEVIEQEFTEVVKRMDHFAAEISRYTKDVVDSRTAAALGAVVLVKNRAEDDLAKAEQVTARNRMLRAGEKPEKMDSYVATNVNRVLTDGINRVDAGLKEIEDVRGVLEKSGIIPVSDDERKMMEKMDYDTSNTSLSGPKRMELFIENARKLEELRAKRKPYDGDNEVSKYITGKMAELGETRKQLEALQSAHRERVVEGGGTYIPGRPATFTDNDGGSKKRK